MQEETKEQPENHSGLTMDIERLSIGADEEMEDEANNSRKIIKKKKKIVQQTIDGPAMRTRKSIAQHMSKLPRKQKVGYVYDDFMLLHRSHKVDHMERPERLMAVYLNLIDKQLLEKLVKINAEYVEESDLKLCHNEKHIALI